MSEPTHKQSSGLAIAGLVLGIIAAATSFLPIINNISAIIAVIGGVLSAIALMGAHKGKHGAKGMSIAGVVLAVVSFALVLATQGMYKAALDNAVEKAKTGSKPVAASTVQDAPAAQDVPEQPTAEQPATEPEPEQPAAEQPAAEPEPEQPAAEQPAPERDYLNLAVGEAVALENGLTIAVNSVQVGLVNYDNTLITCVNVTYSNGSQSNESFNTFDWKGEDAGGAQRGTTYYSEGDNELHSGTLSPGGSVSGNLYFDDGVTRVLYYDNMFNNSATCGWRL